MQAGNLKKRITILRRSPHVNGDGFTVMAYEPLKSVWAKANNLFGSEYWAAFQYNAQHTVEFTIRYSACPDISLSDRILFNGRIYNIDFVDNALYSSDWLKIRAASMEVDEFGKAT